MRQSVSKSMFEEFSFFYVIPGLIHLVANFPIFAAFSPTSSQHFV